MRILVSAAPKQPDLLSEPASCRALGAADDAPEGSAEGLSEKAVRSSEKPTIGAQVPGFRPEPAAGYN